MSMTLLVPCHLSLHTSVSWWKVTKIWHDDPVPFNKIVTSFQAYTRNVKMDIYGTSPLRETLAVIAFQPYPDIRNRASGKWEILTVASLAATLASPLNVGFGRVVVVGYNNLDNDLVQETFRYLRDTVDDTDDKNRNDTVTKLGPMELGYVQVRDDEVRTKFIDTNMPKAALEVLQHALNGTLLDESRTQDLLGTTTDRSYWKYVFLTEPDTILQTRPSALPELKQALDQGLILAPHRLQPLPHESDLIGMQDKSKLVHDTGTFFNIVNLDMLDVAVCCDEHAGNYRPWTDYFENCGIFWWECGFNKKFRRNHNHLSPYSLIRLQQGTGIVSLSATAHGRRCFPQKNSVCTPPSDSSLVRN